MNTESRRQGACDRCRGQKLRCVGLGKPIFNSNSRYQYNEIPCERCKKAKVDCYSAKPTPRRNTAADRAGDTQLAGSPERSLVAQHERGSAFYRSVGQGVTGSTSQQSRLPSSQNQRSKSVDLHNSQLNDRHDRNIDLLSPVPTITSEWMTYLQTDEMGRSELGNETPPWMLDSDMNLYQDPPASSADDNNMINLASQSVSGEWNPNQIDVDANLGQRGSTHHFSSKKQKHSAPDQSMNEPSNTRWPPKRPVQNLESTRSCVQALAKFHEVLLNEKSSLKDASTRDLESGQQSIGQTLQRCQEFLLILQRLRSLCSNTDCSIRRTSSECQYSADDRRLEDGTHLHPLSRGRNCSTTPQSRSHSGSMSISPSSGSSSISLTPAAPSLEIPTLLSILSCYACILQSYDDLFSPILDAVTRPTPIVPATLTGLHLDGFELDGHNTLQLECLVSVSFNLLEKIENILVGHPGHDGLFSRAGGGLLEGKLFAGLIDALYQKNEQNVVSRSNGKPEVRAKRLIREIQAALKVIDL